MVNEGLLFGVLSAICAFLGALIASVISPSLSHRFRINQLKRNHELRKDFLREEILFKKKVEYLESLAAHLVRNREIIQWIPTILNTTNFPEDKESIISFKSRPSHYPEPINYARLEIYGEKNFLSDKYKDVLESSMDILYAYKKIYRILEKKNYLDEYSKIKKQILSKINSANERLTEATDLLLDEIKKELKTS